MREINFRVLCFYYASISTLIYIKKTFDCLEPNDISAEEYYEELKFLGMKKFPEYYVSEALKLFMHIWMKEELDKHRSFVVRKEMAKGGNILVHLTKKNCMEALWSIMDKISSHEIKEFMESQSASYIRSVLNERGDSYSLKKFSSYPNFKGFENSNTM